MFQHEKVNNSSRKNAQNDDWENVHSQMLQIQRKPDQDSERDVDSTEMSMAIPWDITFDINFGVGQTLTASQNNALAAIGALINNYDAAAATAGLIDVAITGCDKNMGDETGTAATRAVTRASAVQTQLGLTIPATQINIKPTAAQVNALQNQVTPPVRGEDWEALGGRLQNIVTVVLKNSDMSQFNNRFIRQVTNQIDNM